MHTDERSGIRVLRLDVDGNPISTPDDATDLVASAWSHRATTVVVPVERLDPTFFDLRSGLAAEIAQTAANYRLRLAVVGDVSKRIAVSTALREFVWESNRGDHLWFVERDDDLTAKLAERTGSGAGSRITSPGAAGAVRADTRAQ